MTERSLQSKDSSAADQNVLPLKRRILWGLGGFGDHMVFWGVTQLILPIFNVGMGIDVRWVGAALGVSRFADAFTDSICGYLSDNTHSRWGRRRPWILAGAIVCFLVMALMWYPPMRAGIWATFAFLTIAFLLLYSVGYTMYIIPYSAQGYELSTDYNERTHILAWRMYFYVAAGLFMPWLFKLCTLPMFGNEVTGARWVGLAIGLVFIAVAIGPLMTKERIQSKSDARISLLGAFRCTLQNRAFRFILTMNFLVKFTMWLTGPFMLYIEIYDVAGGDKGFAAGLFGWMGFTVNLAAIAGMWVNARMCDWIGKKRTSVLYILLSALTFLSFWWTLTPQYPYLQLATSVFVGLFFHPLWLSVFSMMAEVIDEDELETGLRREGMYSAVFSTSDKIAFALCAVFSAFVLKAAGFQEELTMQTPQTLRNLMVLFVSVQCLGMLFGFILLMFCPMSRQRALEVRRQLDARKQKSDSAV